MSEPTDMTAQDMQMAEFSQARVACEAMCAQHQAEAAVFCDMQTAAGSSTDVLAGQ